MIDTKSVLFELYQKGITLNLVEDRLKVSAPEKVLTEEVVEIIKEYREEIKSYLKHERKSASAIERVGRGKGDYAVSPAQLNFLLSDSVNVNSTANLLSSAHRIHGDFRCDIAEQALSRIQSRHEILRTTYHSKSQTWVQRVHPSSGVNVEKLSIDKTDKSLKKVVTDCSRRNFDLSKDFPFRLTWIEQTAETGVLLFTIHHIAADTVTLSLLVKEFVEIYEALIKDIAPRLTPSTVQYVDYALWQKKQFEEGAVTRELEYWRAQLDKAPLSSELPVDKTMTLGSSTKAAVHGQKLSYRLTQSTKKLAATEGMTLFMVLHAAFSYVLARYRGETDIIVGTPVAGRQQPQTESIMGCFVNTLVLRTQCQQGSVKDFLAHVRNVNVEALSNQHIPFDELTRMFNVSSKNGLLPWVQTLFRMGEEPEGKLILPDLISETYPISDIEILVGLSLTAIETEKGIQCYWEYRSESYTQTMIEEVASLFQRTLSQFTENIEQPLLELPIVQAEKISAREKLRDKPRLLPKCFVKTAQDFPHENALVFREKKVTYQQLYRSVNQLAHELLSHKVGPESIVAVMYPRSIEAVIAIQAVLQSGAAVLPIDIEQPRERVNFMLVDSRASLVLSNTTTVEKLLDLNIPYLATDDKASAYRISKRAVESPDVNNIKDEHLAYVIYTSGSTGTPKGVMVEHQQIAYQSAAEIQNYDLRKGDRVLHVVAFSFDPGLAHLLSAFSSGACCYISHPDEDVVARLEKEKITHTSFPASVLAAFYPTTLPHLRLVTVGAETCSRNVARRWARGRRFMYCYGPTETTVIACAGEYDDRNVDAFLGWPVTGIHCYLLDEQQQPVPAGAVGELYIAGTGVSRGYINRPDITSERFLKGLSATAGERVYRTGDLARLRRGEGLEFIGRVDEQVKLNGFRVELGEVENALTSIPEVQRAAVTSQSNEEHKYLVAYYEPKPSYHRQEVWPSISEFNVLDDVMYRSMMDNDDRINAYQSAFQRLLRDKVVLEVGPGSTLVLTTLALKAGAKHIYAVEIDAKAFSAAKQRLKELDGAERVTLIYGDASRVELPEQVDYCISSIVGAIGSAQGAEVVLNSVRHHLKDSTAMLPKHSLNLIHAVDLSDYKFAMSKTAAYYTEKIFNEVGRKFDLRVCLKDFPKNCFLSEGEVFESIDYGKPMTRKRQRHVTLKAFKKGLLSGFLISLKLFVDEFDVVNNLIHKKGLLPIYVPLPGKPIVLYEGQKLYLTIVKEPGENSLHTDFTIKVKFEGESGDALLVRLPHIDETYQGNTFYKDLIGSDEGTKVFDKQEQYNNIKVELQKRLPDYMVPKHYVLVPEMPLTVNGKIDRQSLPKLDVSLVNENRTPLTTEIQEELASIWKELLGNPEISFWCESDFFEMGGHSLLAIKLKQKVKQHLGLDIEIKDIFENAQLAELAELIDNREALIELRGVGANHNFYDEGTL